MGSKFTRKMLAIVASAAMVVAAFSVPIFADTTTNNTWNGNIPSANTSYAFSGGSGTASDPYQIATADDLI